MADCPGNRMTRSSLRAAAARLLGTALAVVTVVIRGVQPLAAQTTPPTTTQTPTTAPQGGSQQPSPDPPAFTTTVTVIEAAPLPGLDLPLEKIPAPVQTASAQDIERSGALDVSSFLTRRVNGVFANEIQSNPFQPDINYRGYTASPLLATRQGISVYMDGVRLNQPFGDVVSWDLIPRLAISTTTVMPGSNPLFGLNTLGGALAIQTKDGATAPGTSVEAIYGSDVRRSVEFEHGGRRPGGLHWYIAGNLFDENGWRDDSPSAVRQIFGKAGWQRPTREFSIAVGHADNSLNGNGLQEEGFLDRGYASVSALDPLDSASWPASMSTWFAVTTMAAISASVMACADTIRGAATRARPMAPTDARYFMTLLEL